MSTKNLVNQPRAGRWLILLLALLTMPLGLRAQESYDITVAGVAVTSENASSITGDNITAGTVSFDPQTNTLTLNGATINGEILSSLETLTINLVEENHLTSANNQNSALQNEGDMADLSFTGSGSLAINAEGGVIGDFSSVDFGSFNLASQAPGAHYDDSSIRSYDGYLVSDLTITTAEVYPIWVIDKSITNSAYSHTQITAANKTNVLNDETVSFSGSTITLNGVDFNLGEQSAIVVGQGISSLTAYLKGTNTITNGPAFYFVDKTNLIFTTDTSNPGSLEAPELANWAGEYETGEITYKNGLVHTISDDKHYVDRRTLYYGLNVAGIRVSNLNAEDILNDGGSVSYKQDEWGSNRTLTLNNATINGKIDFYGGGYTIDILGDNTIVSTDSAAIKNSNEGLTSDLTFRSSGNTLATLKLTPGGASFKAYEGFYINNMDNTSIFGELNNDDQSPVAGAVITIKRVPAPVFNFPQGVVFTDEDLTVTMDIPSDDYDIYWTGKSEYGQYKKSTGTFRLTTDDDSYGGYGNPSVYAYVADKNENKRRTNDVVRMLVVVDRPTFSVAGGEYTTAQQVAIQGLPELETRQHYVEDESQDFPQVWYYFDNDKENAVQYNSEETITVDHTCRLNAYLMAVNDSGIVVNSSLFSADYIIRKEPNYCFTDDPTGHSSYPNGSTVYNLDFGQENTLPWLINVPNGLAITYRTSDEATATINQEGHITLTGAGHVWIYASNEETDDYVAHTDSIRLEIRPMDPQTSIVQGAYYTGQKLELISTVPNGEMYYRYSTEEEKVKYTEPLTLAKGKWEIYFYTKCGSGNDEMWSYGNNHPTYYVYDELTFTPESGTTSNDNITVEIGNLPSSTPNATSVFYFFGEDDEDDTNDLEYNTTNKVNVAESTKVTAYIKVKGDSGYVYKTEPVEAEYVIRTVPELSFVDGNNEPVEVAEWTIGGTENQPLPTVKNELQLQVTYSSTQTGVATVDNNGSVTPVGVGETYIKATSTQTDIYRSTEISYLLHVYKMLNHESITIEAIGDQPYTGAPIEPTVTVKDGQTDITNYVDIAYSNNVAVGTSALVTITPKETEVVNYYKGSATTSFNIVNRTLVEGEDVTFASGQSWASYFTNSETLEVPEGIVAYVLTGVNGGTLTAQAISKVPQNIPVLLEKTNNAVTTNDTYDENLLRGTAEATSVTGIEGVVYVLYNGEFVRTKSGTIPAHRAYLVLSSDAGARLSIGFDDEATGIRNMEADGNGNDVWFSLDGQRFDKKPAKKGLYIHNGEKEFVK